MNSGQTLFFRASASCSKILNDKKYFNRPTVKNLRANSVFQGKRRLVKILNDNKYIFNAVNSGHIVFQGKRKLLKNLVNGKKYIQNSENFQDKLFFRASASCSKILKDKKYFDTVKKFKATVFFRASASFFIVNTSEFTYFFFKSGESHERRQWLLVPHLTGWLSQWAVRHKLSWWALAVQLPLYQLCNLHVSYRVGLMFIYTFNNVLLLYALAFHSLALPSRCV